MGSSSRKPTARRTRPAARAEETSKPAPPAAGGGPPSESLGPGRVGGLVLLAMLVGVLAGVGSSLFVAVEHHLQAWLWTDLPEALGHDSAPWWLAVIILATGSLVVAVATRLPGHGGHSPLDGLGLDIGPREITSVVLAALGSLSFGAVLGPEAPLMAVGTALGALAVRGSTSPVRSVMMLAGAMAAIGTIFGNPIITAVLLLEVAVFAGGRLAAPPVLLAALGALASGFVLQVGMAGWSGLGEAELAVPGLPEYPTLRLVDVAVGIPVAVVVAVAAIAARVGAHRLSTVARRAPVPTLLAAGIVVAGAAIAVSETTGVGLDLVLFSGQAAIPDYLALTSVGTAAVVLVGKFVAYAVSLGSGFRGGAIFPAIALGVIVAAAASLLVESASLSALVATGIAAGTAAAIRLPFVATLLAVLLTYPAGGATTVTAVVGTVIGILTRQVADSRMDSTSPSSGH